MMKQVNSSMVMKLISRVERMGSMGWLQHQLWWRHTDQGEGVQEEKVVGCCYNNLFIIVTTIITITTITIIAIIKFFMIAISLNQLSTSATMIIISDDHLCRCEGVGKEGRVCNTFSCSGFHC